MPGYEKDVPCEQVFPRYREAVERAVKLDHWQETRGCAGENPSTGVHRLTERIMELSRDEQLKKHAVTQR
jgi:hypothetical protein